jgi:hypothetical protein
VGFLDALLGRSKPAEANLDKLFGLPGARITLEASEGVVPTLQAGVCFKPATGQAFAATESEISGLLDLPADDAPAPASAAAATGAAALPGGAGGGSGAKLSEQADEYGYRWIVIGAPDFDTLVTRVHFVNSTLHDNGYGPTLLCSVFGFAPSSAAGARASTYLVYLYKRGSFYPFVPAGGERRDNEAELRLKALLGEDLAIEPDLDRWFPLWNLPVH